MELANCWNKITATPERVIYKHTSEDRELWFWHGDRSDIELIDGYEKSQNVAADRFDTIEDLGWAFPQYVNDDHPVVRYPARAYRHGISHVF